MLKLNYSRLIIGFVLIVGILLGWEGYSAYQHFRSYQQQLSAKTADSLAQEIHIYAHSLGRKALLFSQEKSALLKNIYQQGEQTDLYPQLETAIKNWFPHAYDFSVVNHKGIALLPQTQHLSNSTCLLELGRLSMAGYQVMLHDKEGKDPHIDILSSFAVDGDMGVFFINLPMTDLQRLLTHAQISGHQLALWDQTKEKPLHLYADSHNKVWQSPTAARAQVKDSDWFIYDRVKEEVYQEKIWALSSRALLIFICISLIAFLLWRSLDKAQRQGGDTFQMLSGIEAERRRIAMDMHDQVLAELSHIGRDLSSLMPSAPEPLQMRLQQMERELTELNTGIRHIIDDLHPQALEMLGLESALRLYLEKRCSPADAPDFQLDMRGDLNADLSTEQALGLYRVILEVINNSLKHAQCQQGYIRIEQQAQSLWICVEDDGKGMPSVSNKNKGGRGLANIHTRSRMLQARIQWGKPQQYQQGTRFELRLPLGV